MLDLIHDYVWKEGQANPCLVPAELADAESANAPTHTIPLPSTMRDQTVAR